MRLTKKDFLKLFIIVIILMFIILILLSHPKDHQVPTNGPVLREEKETPEQSAALETYLLDGQEDPERLTELLKKGEDPNLVFYFHNSAITGYEVTALMAAISQKRYKDCDVLLSHGADINKRAGILQATALDLMTSIGTIDQMKYLLVKGADPDIPVADDGKTEVSDGATPLIEAVKKQDLEKVQLLLQYKANPNVSLSDNGKIEGNNGTPVISIAAFNNNITIASMLLKAGVDPNKPRSNNGKTSLSDGSPPLSAAIAVNSIEMVKLLLAYGANPNAARSSNGLCELSDGTTVLMEAVMSNSIAIVKALVEAGAKVNTPRSGDEKINSHDGGFPLYIASQGNYIEIVEYLILNGADVNQARQDSSKMSSLMTAAYLGNIDVVKILINAGANVNLVSPKFGTALDNAIDGGHDEIAGYLKQHGAKRTQSYSEQGN